MKKKTAVVLLCAVIVIAAAARICTNFIGKKPFASLKAEDIASATVQLLPPNQTAPVTDLDALAAALNDAVIYRKDGSYTEYNGQAVIYTIVLKDGTERAVKYFQRTNGLSADGQVGDLTLAALGITPTGSSGGGSSGGGSGDVDLLARLISAEARGEPYEGQVAVGAVVLNRVKHASFPNSISGVIYQSGAFSCLYDGQFDQPVAESAYRAARATR